MGERYLITGVQLGMLVALDDKDKREKAVNEIIDNQFVANTVNTDVEKDADELYKYMLNRK